MEKFDIIHDVAERTGGSVYVGVVGPVRTGKSTFIKRFMDLLVMPNIRDQYDKERTRDELPQSSAGKTIMTTQPKFVPDEPVEIAIQDQARVRVRLVDCVGYSVSGASGYEEGGAPRMVRTPWFDHDIPFNEAAETGTRKVISDHSTIGLVIVTDGSITEIPRENYLPAEERVIRELQDLKKPFLVVLNSTRPESRGTTELAAQLSEKYRVPVIPLDCLNMSSQDLLDVLHEILFEFPVKEVGVRFQEWVEELDSDHWLRRKLEAAVVEAMDKVERVRDVPAAAVELSGKEFVEKAALESMELGTGSAMMDVLADETLFYKVIEEMTGYEVVGDHHLLRLMKELALAKREYDKVAGALSAVRENGYGIVTPVLDEISFQDPELIRQGHRFGVRLKASAPSIHMVKADITAEVTPFVGTEKQGEEFARYLSEEFEKDPVRVWASEFLGKPLQEIVKEGIQSKLHRMPENAQVKLQETLTKIINEGSGGLICIIL